MSRQASFKFRYLVAPGVCLKLQTNLNETGRLVSLSLFPKRAGRTTAKTIRLRVSYNPIRDSFFLYSPFKRKPLTCSSQTLLPILDHEVRLGILLCLPNFLFPVHSAAAVKRKQTILLLGESGFGKSTAMFDLARNGYGGLSDELNFIDLRTFRILPYFRNWSLKLIPHRLKSKKHFWVLAPRLFGNRYKKIPVAYFKNSFTNKKAGAPLRFIFYLKSRLSKTAAIRELSVAETLQRLIENSYIRPFRSQTHSPRLARKFGRLAENLFRSHKKLSFMRAYEIATTKRRSFSELIIRKRLA